MAILEGVSRSEENYPMGTHHMVRLIEWMAETVALEGVVLSAALLLMAFVIQTHPS
jgi:hypothetical protein